MFKLYLCVILIAASLTAILAESGISAVKANVVNYELVK